MYRETSPMWHHLSMPAPKRKPRAIVSADKVGAFPIRVRNRIKRIGVESLRTAAGRIAKTDDTLAHVKRHA